MTKCQLESRIKLDREILLRHRLFRHREEPLKTAFPSSPPTRTGTRSKRCAAWPRFHERVTTPGRAGRRPTSEREYGWSRACLTDTIQSIGTPIEVDRSASSDGSAPRAARLMADAELLGTSSRKRWAPWVGLDKEVRFKRSGAGATSVPARTS